MKNRVGQSNRPGKDADTMTVTLNRENTRNLRFAARMIQVEPERLLNDWILRDPLRDRREPGSGALRDLVEMTAFSSEEEALSVAGNVARHEQRRGAGFRPLAPEVRGG